MDASLEGRRFREAESSRQCPAAGGLGEHSLHRHVLCLVNAGREMVEGVNLTWVFAVTNQSLVGSDGTTYSGNSPAATTVTTGFARFALTEACKLRDNRGFVKIHWPLRVL